MDQPKEKAQQPEPEEAENDRTRCESSKETGTKAKNDLSDVVTFSLTALCAIKQLHLYPEEYHESFRSEYLSRMLSHFGLPDRVMSSIKEFIQEDEFTFLSSIKQNHRSGIFKLIEQLVLLSVKSGTYDARSHYLILEVAESLGIPRELVEIHCESIYDPRCKTQSNNCKVAETSETEANDKDRERRETRNKIKKYFIIGLGSMAGGAVIGVTGGLAAPVVASAFAGVIGAGSVVMSSAAAGIVGSLFGVAGAGLTASKMNKRIGDLEEFAFESMSPGHEQKSLTITIAISGWINDTNPDNFSRPWKALRHSKEQYCLCYESKYLLELSQAMDYLLSFVVSYATQEALKYTFLASVMAAIAWPTALISIANIIDNPWDVCLGRSAQAGKHLADVLLSRQQGRRPASLIGFSLGARVIFYCLQELSQRKDCEGMVGDVVLLGAPVTASVDQWKPLGRVVSGRIINGYSSSDWLLKFLYRTSSAAIRVAGLQAINWSDRRLSNYDLTPLVGGHSDYYKKLTEILDFVGVKIFETPYLEHNESSPNLEELAPMAASAIIRGDLASVASSQVDGQKSLDSGLVQSTSNSTNISTSLSEQSVPSAAEIVNINSDKSANTSHKVSIDNYISGSLERLNLRHGNTGQLMSQKTEVGSLGRHGKEAPCTESHYSLPVRRHARKRYKSGCEMASRVFQLHRNRSQPAKSLAVSLYRADVKSSVVNTNTLDDLRRGRFAPAMMRSRSI